MTYQYEQLCLDLFPLPSVVVDSTIDSTLASTALSALQQRRNTIIHSIIHPNTIDDTLVNMANKSKMSFGELTDVYVNVKRMKTFSNSMKCACCGCEANVFVIEENTNDLRNAKYLNLYSVTDSTAVEMTVDHTLPQSWFGGDSTTNRETMCQPCNQKKANTMDRAEVVRIMEDVSSYAKNWVNSDFIQSLLQLYLVMLDAPDDKSRQIRAKLQKFKTGVRESTSLKSLNDKTEELNRLIDQYTTSPDAPPPVTVKPSWFTTVVNVVASQVGKIMQLSKLST